MPIAAAFIVYLTIFRLAIVAVGTTSIVLGFRLFTRAMARDDTSLAGQIGAVKISLQNAAPGTCFAFFGAAVVVAMLVEGSPAMTVSGLREANDMLNAPAGAMTLRALGIEAPAARSRSLDEILARGAAQQAQANTAGAITTYSQALALPGVTLAELVEPIARTAEIYVEGKRWDEARALAGIALIADPDNPRLLYLRSAIESGRGDYRAACDWAQKALARDPSNRTYADQLTHCTRQPDGGAVQGSGGSSSDN